ncbi:MAG: hypothetical protein HY000_38025 [Planctomycetes bacterium]|nr:hypothetical protein [Planctomycetia bacterium]MBI3468838.1 hypothetical protein [Planctomycetota bacterium]
MRGKPYRGLQDLRTNGSAAGGRSDPQRRFLRLAILGLQKIRRQRERETAMGRLREIEQRLQDIEQEEAGLIGAVEAEGGRRSPAQRSASKRASADGTPKPEAAFTVRY